MDLSGIIERHKSPFQSSDSQRKDIDHLLKLVRRMADKTEEACIFYDGRNEQYECLECGGMNRHSDKISHSPNCLFLVAQQVLEEIPEEK